MSTHIYIVSSEDSSSVVAKLNSVFNVNTNQKKKSLSAPFYETFVKKIPCYLSKKEKKAINFYLLKNSKFTFTALKLFLIEKGTPPDNAILSSYLRANGYAPLRIKCLQENKYKKYWSKRIV